MPYGLPNGGGIKESVRGGCKGQGRSSQETINTEKQMFNSSADSVLFNWQLCSPESIPTVAAVGRSSSWCPRGSQFPHRQCSHPQDGLVHRMERRGHGRVDAEKGVAGPRGTGRQWTAPLITCGMEKM